MAATLGEVLRDLRVRRKMTQAKLAEKLDLSPSDVAKIENSNHDPSLETFRKYVDFFHISADALLYYKLRGDLY